MNQLQTDVTSCFLKAQNALFAMKQSFPENWSTPRNCEELSGYVKETIPETMECLTLGIPEFLNSFPVSGRLRNPKWRTENICFVRVRKKVCKLDSFVSNRKTVWYLWCAHKVSERHFPLLHSELCAFSFQTKTWCVVRKTDARTERWASNVLYFLATNVRTTQAFNFICSKVWTGNCLASAKTFKITITVPCLFLTKKCWTWHKTKTVSWLFWQKGVVVSLFCNLWAGIKQRGKHSREVIPA